MTRRHRTKQSGVSSAIASALVIALSLALHPLAARAATPEVESPRSFVETPSSRPGQASLDVGANNATPPGIADLLSLVFIAGLWALSSKAARHHRSTRARRRARAAAWLSPGAAMPVVRHRSR